LARGSETLWLGAAQFGASLDYVWTDHTPFDFENWPNGENSFNARPPYDPGRRCTKMNTRTQEWFQSCCKDPSPYVCEMKPSSPVTTSVDSYQYAYYSTTKPPYYNTYPREHDHSNSTIAKMNESLHQLGNR
uniref:C-type lectin domain-containing protein n=1 Tax=Anisakis simplex TaxID=6269 RepID=A0A0M3KBQ6_ANISI